MTQTTLFVLITLALCRLLSACGPATSTASLADSMVMNRPAAAQNVVVRCQPARSGTFWLRSLSNGVVRAPAQSRLSFRIGGTIREIAVRTGQPVAAGQVMARLDDRDQLINLRVAQDQLTEAKVQLRALIAEYNGEDIDTMSVKQPNARAFILTKSGYYKAQTALMQARQQLDYTILRAPYAGVVANLTARPYNFITSFEPFCTLLSRAGLLVEFSVLETELPAVRVGLPVQVKPVALSGRSYGGQVAEINPLVNAQGLVLVKSRINHPDAALFEGMNARVVIERRVPGQVIIPKEAVVERSGRKVVFTAENGLAKWHYVTVAHENDTEVAISEGLRAGEPVIVSGQLNLGHGAPVTVEQP
ncbi:efflux RND transporter periplasmic adaptor subunit [Spirosoma flavum]|uniref:Efflux RND transporter periplasmic adaptor subunit n=1 Tax=Spirosoma flavum TaxID=2048557 RepID=A0ABW6ATW6_9BACT